MLTEKHIDELWKRMAEIYGHKWTSSHGDVDSGTWLSALRNIPEDRIVSGMNKLLLRSDTWPPTLPEFLQLCIGLPDIGTATQKVMRMEFTDPISQAIKQKIGTWALTHETESQIKSKIRDIYPIVYQEQIESVISKNTVTSIDNASRKKIG